MKIISKILLLLFVSFTGYGQLSRNEVKQILLCSKIVLVRISPIPVEQPYRDSNKTYVHGYEILNQLKVDTANQMILSKAIVDTINYIFNYSRACEFLPTYAIKFDKKCTIFLSSGTCPKILYVPYKKNKKNKEHMIDLSDTNSISGIISKLI